MKILLPFQDPYNRPLEYPICSGGTESFCKSIYDNFDTEVYDSDSAYNTTDKRFTVPSGAAGKYAIFADVSCDSQADANLDYAYVYIYKNGSNIRQSGIDFRNNFGRRNFCHIYSVEDLAVSDYIEIFVLTFDNSGSAIVTGGTANSRFMMWKIT